MAAVLFPLSFFVILVALYSSQLSPPAATASPGDWFSINNLTDPNVVKVANFSVTEHNKNQSNNNLLIESKSMRIFKGEIQVVNGLNYKLEIAAKYIGKSKPNNFETFVYQKSDQNMTLTLVSFNITTNY